MGVQMMPVVCETMKAMVDAVMCWAAMIRSPSFSREGESSTMMKRPFSRRGGGVSFFFFSAYWVGVWARSY